MIIIYRIIVLNAGYMEIHQDVKCFRCMVSYKGNRQNLVSVKHVILSPTFHFLPESYYLEILRFAYQPSIWKRQLFVFEEKIRIRFSWNFKKQNCSVDSANVCKKTMECVGVSWYSWTWWNVFVEALWKLSLNSAWRDEIWRHRKKRKNTLPVVDRPA